MKFYALLALLFLTMIAADAVQAQEIIPPQQIISAPATVPPPPPAAVVLAPGKPYCREYTQNLTIAGKTQSGYGTACLQPDGSWELRPTVKHVPVVTPGGQTVYTTVQTIQYVTRGPHVYVIPPQPYVVVAAAPVIIEQAPVVEVIGGRYHHWH